MLQISPGKPFRSICKSLALAILMVQVTGCWQPASAQQAVAVATAPAAHKPEVFAHRGGRNWAPENTLTAFKKSLDVHVDGVELDIHRCKSGELVVIHDENVARTTHGTGLIRDLTWTEIRKLDAGSWYGPEFKGEHLPLLSEVLDLVDGKATINIEIKNIPIAYPGIEDDLLKLLSTYKHPDKIVISSFDHAVLQRIHEKTNKYKLEMLIDGLLVNLGKYAETIGVKAWNPAYDSIRADSVADAHKDGLEVNVWTVNKPERWKTAIDMGVDGIITDDPKGLIDYLEKK